MQSGINAHAIVLSSCSNKLTRLKQNNPSRDVLRCRPFVTTRALPLRLQPLKVSSFCTAEFKEQPTLEEALCLCGPTLVRWFDTHQKRYQTPPAEKLITNMVTEGVTVLPHIGSRNSSWNPRKGPRYVGDIVVQVS